jgi:hypothetical protein
MKDTDRIWASSWRSSSRYHAIDPKTGASLCKRIKENGWGQARFNYEEVTFLACGHCRNTQVKLIKGS